MVDLLSLLDRVLRADDVLFRSLSTMPKSDSSVERAGKAIANRVEARVDDKAQSTKATRRDSRHRSGLPPDREVKAGRSAQTPSDDPEERETKEERGRVATAFL